MQLEKNDRPKLEQSEECSKINIQSRKNMFHTAAAIEYYENGCRYCILNPHLQVHGTMPNGSSFFFIVMLQFLSL